jgi:uncharacterized protein (DUF3084 family)
MEEDIFSKIQSNPSPKEGETCNRFETSNLHNNDKFIKAINDFKFQIQQLIVATEQNKTAISNLESICQTPQSSSDTAYLELHTLRKEYELVCSENANLKKENVEFLERMNNSVYIASDLNTKIRILEEEKACLITSVRLVNEDKRQLIVEANRLRNDYERIPSPDVTNQVVMHSENTQNKKPIQDDRLIK